MYQLRRLLLAAVLSCSLPAHALTLLTEENPPLNFTEKGKVTGASTEVLEEAARRAKVPLTIVMGNWKDSYQRAQTSKDTCVYSTAKLDARKNVFKWVGPIAVNRWGLFAKEGFNAPIKTVADARPFRIGGVTFDAKTEFLKENAVTNITEAAEDRLNPPKLTLDRKEPQKIDLWVTSLARAKSVAEQAGVKDVKLVFAGPSIPTWLACSPATSPDTIKVLDEALAGMRKDGSYDKILAKYDLK